MILCKMLYLFLLSSETARTGGASQDGCNPGEKTTCWGPQWLVFPGQATGGGAGTPRFGGEKPSGQCLEAEHVEQRQVSGCFHIHIENNT